MRVLELAGGPAAVAGRLLALLGADVVVPCDRNGADCRPASDWAAAGKRAIRTADVERLLAAADVVLGRDVPGHPGLVRCVVTPFGEHGPRAAWRSSELVAQALGGMLAASGQPAGPPLAAPALQAEQQAGVFAAIGTLAALLARRHDGRGQRVEVSVQAAVAATLAHVHARFLHDGTVTRRSGRMHWSRCFRVGPTRDGWAAYTTLGDWTTLVEWMRADGAAQDLVDPVFADAAVRRTRAEHVFDVLEAWGRAYAGAALEEEAQLRRLAVARVRRPAEVTADRQLAARGFFIDGRPGPPFRLGPLPARAGVVPDAGRDPDAVLRDWLAPRPAPAVAAGRQLERPLAGMRVADFTWLIAGPTATSVLADLGADVIKIEHPATVDAGDRRGGFTGALNRGKRSVVLDLSSAAGLRAAERLVDSADVVIDNFSARVMEQWRLDPTTLRRRRPELVCVRMTGFGLTGPDRERVSFGPTIEARAGYTALMADHDGAPVGFGFSYADVASGHLAALAVLAAWWRRLSTGEGATIDFSQLEALVSLLAPALARDAPEPGAPDGVYPCASEDRWIAISAAEEEDWHRLVAAIGRPAWTGEPRFASRADRVRHRDALDAHVAAWTRSQDAEAVMLRLQNAGVAAGVVANAVDLCERDPQLAAWGFFATVATPEGGTVRIGGPPYRLSDTPARVSGPGPLVGEHSAAVLETLSAGSAASA
ncbi:MAG TPA: CoA transferase [Candidatus Limnocylindria bacterium]|nr:CoA transferase [Candidatus Limnocylindria bacterium]